MSSHETPAGRSKAPFTDVGNAFTQFSEHLASELYGEQGPAKLDEARRRRDEISAAKHKTRLAAERTRQKQEFWQRILTRAAGWTLLLIMLMLVVLVFSVTVGVTKWAF